MKPNLFRFFINIENAFSKPGVRLKNKVQLEVVKVS